MANNLLTGDSTGFYDLDEKLGEKWMLECQWNKRVDEAFPDEKCNECQLRFKCLFMRAQKINIVEYSSYAIQYTTYSVDGEKALEDYYDYGCDSALFHVTGEHGGDTDTEVNEVALDMEIVHQRKLKEMQAKFEEAENES